MTIVAPYVKTLTLPIGEILTIATTNAQGFVTRLADNPGGGSPLSQTVINGANLVFGPYQTAARLQITVNVGSLTDTITNYDAKLGTTLGDNAIAGNVGEYVTAQVATGSSVGLTTATPANVTSISLSPGDWDVEGTVFFDPAASTSITQLEAGVSGAGSATFDTFDRTAMQSVPAQVPGAHDTGLGTPESRFNLTVTTTIYLVAQATFTVSTLKAYGIIRARRMR